MCLYPKLILNKKYMPTKKNDYKPPILTDQRLKWVAVGCGQCIECRKQKARAWQVRLHEEMKNKVPAYFVTLTFSPESIVDLQKRFAISNVNELATKGTRLFLERIRKKYKKSIKHWFITELGHTNTERIHIHGILFTDKPIQDILAFWNYGNIYCGEYCTAQTVNYIVKYMLKIDHDHKNYLPKILCSPGLGSTYDKITTKIYHAYRPKETREYYTLNNGTRINLPIYYRNKFFNEEQREQLWVEKIEKGEIWVRGIKIENIDTPEGHKRYEKLLKREQKRNIELGYGDDSEEWKQSDYMITFKMLQKGK